MAVSGVLVYGGKVVIQELARICKGRNIIIQMHNFPDVDAIASAWGLGFLLKEYGITSRLVYCGDINRTSTERLVSCFQIPIEEHSGEFSDDDYIITVDCQSGENNVTQKGGHAIACIDHHPEADKDALFEYKFVKITGACASHITNEFIQNNIEMPGGLATALLFALKKDTLQFTRGVTGLDIDMFKYLHDKADDDTIHYLDNMNIEFSDLKAFGVAIENIYTVGDIGISYVPFYCPDGLIAALAEFILGINDLNVVVVFSKQKYGMKLSVRSIVSEIHAGSFIKGALDGIGSGGGHAMFAGGFIPQKSIDQFEEKEFSKYLKKVFLKQYGKCLMENI